MRLSRDYALGWVLLGLFLIFWVGQTVVGWQEFLAEQAALGEAVVVFGADGYVWNWARTTLENWQSEMLQLFAMVVLTSFLIFRGSPQSKDGDEEMKQTLARFERRLEELANDRSLVKSNGNGARVDRIGPISGRLAGD